jgi:hypothetical protein
MENVCTHTSGWWKNQTVCPCCGELYSDEKADAIAELHTIRKFNPEQQASIDEMEARAFEGDAI